MFKINIIYSLKYIEWLTIFRAVRACKIHKIYSEILQKLRYLTVIKSDHTHLTLILNVN